MGTFGALHTQTPHTTLKPPKRGDFRRAPHPNSPHNAQTTNAWGLSARSAPKLPTQRSNHQCVGTFGALGGDRGRLSEVGWSSGVPPDLRDTPDNQPTPTGWS
ncbi:hypothetical protein Apa02nite_079180 [Actinoplanes palleronii]|uniref:Uncharacterized protein n=1 Tax=Actinoplanes palleronii TaxID=113570 RepID=A0ABQ4BMA4_9ACTN|nr:hypothetical protein Apa02nite_079180 [Actinoplanes palleronii]